jgi:hypothetical protein
MATWIGDMDSDMDGDMDSDMDDTEFGSDEEEKTKESFDAFEEDIEEIDLSPAEQMREYVEKVGETYKGGKVAATSETTADNKKSPVAGKNDMGGTTKNIVAGGEGGGRNDAPGAYSNKAGDLNSGNVNVPGAKKATTLQKRTEGHGVEKKDTRDEAQNKKSLIGSK